MNPSEDRNGLFRLAARLPADPGHVPMFGATRFRSFGSRDAEHAQDLARRIALARRRFDLAGEPVVEGPRIALRTAHQSLEVYPASDSMWWTDHRLANPERLADGARVPDAVSARKLAAAFLAKHEVDVRAASVANVSPVAVDVQERDGPVRSVVTAMDVDYRFSLDGRPVVGPGAKIKVTLAGDGVPAQLLHFWRTPSPRGEHAAIGPGQALERFMRDPAFYRLRNKDAVVEVHAIRFAYYAMSPTEFQRVYVPVWVIDATSRTRALTHEFRRHVVAIDVTPEAAKRGDLVADPRACRVF